MSGENEYYYNYVAHGLRLRERVITHGEIVACWLQLRGRDIICRNMAAHGLRLRGRDIIRGKIVGCVIRRGINHNHIVVVTVVTGDALTVGGVRRQELVKTLAILDDLVKFILIRFGNSIIANGGLEATEGVSIAFVLCMRIDPVLQTLFGATS